MIIQNLVIDKRVLRIVRHCQYVYNSPMSEKLSPWVYRNSLGKQRSIKDPQTAVHESDLRRSYFNTLEEPLLTSLRSYTDKIQYIGIVGSVANNAASNTSDIDILVVVEPDTSFREFSYIEDGSIYVEESYNIESTYQLHIFCDWFQPPVKVSAS